MSEAKRHRWNSWPGYQQVHERKVADYLGHFILADEVRATMTDRAVLWEGTFHCRDGLEIEVTKHQTVRLARGRVEVRTLDYRYQVQARTELGTRPLFRYDNSHPHTGHATAHHRHRFDGGGTQVYPPEHMGDDGWPTLGDVIDELHAWWVVNRPDESEISDG